MLNVSSSAPDPGAGQATLVGNAAFNGTIIVSCVLYVVSFHEFTLPSFSSGLSYLSDLIIYLFNFVFLHAYVIATQGPSLCGDNCVTA